MTLVIIGCTTLKRSIGDYNECYNDPTCREKISFPQDNPDTTPEVFKWATGMLSSLFTGVFLGRLKRKEKV